jgi:hypothetical protein
MSEYSSRGLGVFDSFFIAGETSNQLFGAISSYNTFLSSYLGVRQRVTMLRYDFSRLEANVAAVLANMPQYPDEGSLIIIDDKIFVKFSFDAQ